MAAQTAAITKKTHCKIGTYCGNHLNAATTYILQWFSIPPLKHIYCGGSIYRRCSIQQKTRTTATVQWNATIDPMYSGGPKKRCNM